MSAWENIRQRVQTPSQGAVDDDFTPEERRRLIALRARAASLCVAEVAGLNAQRLAFARWLVEHGYLSEGHEVTVITSSESKW